MPEAHITQDDSPKVQTRTYEIPFFPDLSLPRYINLFGDQALSVAASRLLGWVKLLASSGERFSFVLRYRYDPEGGSSKRNQRLRLQILLRREALADETEEFGESMVRSVLRLDSVPSSVIDLSEAHLRHLVVLSRRENFSCEAGVVHYRPERWKRSARSRQALEPFLDEVFDGIDEPAFLDVRLSPADTQSLHAALRAAIADLEGAKDKSYYAESQREAYKAYLEDVATSPVCQAVVCAGAATITSAQRLLQVFAIETTGGTGFEVHHVKMTSRSRSGLVQSGLGGEYFQPFQTKDGWFSRELQEFCQKNGSKQMDRYQLLSQIRVLAGPDLLEDFLTLPIPRNGYLRTFPLETELLGSLRTSSPGPESAAGVVILGRDLEHHTSAVLELGQLTKHAFVAGVTGSGKSVSMFNILRQLGEQRVPFLVFEPAKTEYRGLVRFDPYFSQNLRVYTPGREHLNPLRLNPFEFGAGISLAEHVANLMAAFQGALPLWEPMPSILEEAIWDLYTERGWSEADEGSCSLPFPRMSDVLASIGSVLDRFEYDAENDAKFRGAFRSRFVRLTRGSLGRFFDAPRTDPSPDVLFQHPTVMELHSLSSEQINLATMFLLIALREYLKTRPASNQLCLAMVLEEAHNLVPSGDRKAGEGEVDTKGEATRYVTNMLAEMRALGLAILVVDQTPSAVSPYVMKNTNLKLVHRTVAKDDRETLAQGMLMNPAQEQLLGRLLPGQAFLYSEQFYRPALIANAFVEPPPICAGDDPTSVLKEEYFESWLTGREWYAASITRRLVKAQEQLSGNLVRAQEWEMFSKEDLEVLRRAKRGEPGFERARETLSETHCTAVSELAHSIRKATEELRTLQKIINRWDAADLRGIPTVSDTEALFQDNSARLREAGSILSTLGAIQTRLHNQNMIHFDERS